LENLTADGHTIKENFETFCRVSIRRLGRLLPEARWVNFQPFPELVNKICLFITFLEITDELQFFWTSLYFLLWTIGTKGRLIRQGY
jgi:hypothetical protein